MVKDPQTALLNACLTLMADHKGSTPLALRGTVPGAFETDIARDQFGNALSGFRLGPDDPFNVTWCAVPTAQAALDDIADIALFSGPGIDGDLRAMHSFFHRPDGWSTIGTGGQASTRIFRKGPIVRAFLDPLASLAPLNPLLEAYLIGQNFISIDPDGKLYVPRFPEMPASLTYLSQSEMMDVYKEGNVTAYVQAGNAQLFDAVRDSAAGENGNLLVSHSSISEDAFIVIGQYAQSQRHFSWIGFRSGLESAVIRLETARMDGAAPDAEDQGIVSRLQCAVSFQGKQLYC